MYISQIIKLNKNIKPYKRLERGEQGKIYGCSSCAWSNVNNGKHLELLQTMLSVDGAMIITLEPFVVISNKERIVSIYYYTYVYCKYSLYI